MKTFKLLSFSLLLSFVFVLATGFTDDSKEKERIQKSAAVLHDFSQMKETSIPTELFNQAEGIIIVPKMINAGFGIGGKRGKGVAMVKLSNGTWSDPVFVTFTAGSVGFQIGVQAVDLVLIFKHKGVLTKVENGDFTFGGDISAAAGPVGRSSTASTDYKFDAEVYSYSRSKGLFAGISINGSNIGIDKTSIANFYGSGATSQSLFASSKNTSSEVVSLKQALKSMQ